MYSTYQALSAYILAIIVSSIAGGALALLGMHLAARDRSVQTLCITQGSMLGVLVALGIGGFFHETFVTQSVLPIIGAFVFANGTYVVCEKLIEGKLASKNSTLVALFATLIACCNLASALFPSLENHMTQKFFGDLATIAGGELALIAVVSIGSGVLLIKEWKRMSCESLDLALFGRSGIFGGKSFDPKVFRLTSFLLICLSVQSMGFLYTAGALMIPTTIQSLSKGRGLLLHQRNVMILASVATFVGFAVSIINGYLPTVPTIVFTMAALGYPMLKVLNKIKV